MNDRARLTAAAAAGFALITVVGACADDAIDAGSGGAPSTATGTTTTASGQSGSGGSTASQTTGSSGGDTTSSGGGEGGAASTSSTGAGGPPTEIATCLGMVYACGNLEDDDADGLIDSQDPDCLGPCDDTEDSFFGGIPGQEGDPCRVDCYFDFDSGQGNDECFWSHVCDPNEVAPGYYPEPDNGALCAYDPDAMVPTDGPPGSCDDLYASQRDTCHEYCGPLTPNGCDCFGCCELPAGSNDYVWLGSRGADGTSVCTLADIDDPTKCHPCLPVAACLNDCGPCEVCIGKPLPGPECSGGEGGGSGSGGSGSGGSGSGSGGGAQCADGIQACGLPGQDPCVAGYFCLTGCCQAVPN